MNREKHTKQDEDLVRQLDERRTHSRTRWAARSLAHCKRLLCRVRRRELKQRLVSEAW